MSKGLVGTVEGFSKDVLLVRAQDGSVKRIVFSGTTASDIAKAEGLDDLTQIVGKQVRVSEDGSEFLFFDEVVPKSQTKDYKPPAKPKKAPNSQGLDFGTGKPEPVEEPTGEGVFEGDKEKDPKHVAKGKEKWMQEAFSEKSSGALHKALGVPKDHKFTITELEGHKKKLSQKAKKSKLTKSELHLEKMLVSAINAMRSKKGSLGEGDPDKVVGTSFCNFGHRLRDGAPVDHECYILPPEMLRAELSGDHPKALELLDAAKPLRHHMGIRPGKDSLVKSACQANIYYETELVGSATLTEEEALHFANAPRCTAGVVLSDQDLERLGLDPGDAVSVDVQGEVPRQGSLPKKATGEPDQNYDHEFFDEITEQLIQSNFQHVTHKEFDKYQGIYLRVGDIRETFWVDEVFYTGEIEHWVFYPQSNREDTAEVTKGPGGIVDASSLVNYCRQVRGRLLKEQNFKRAPGKQAVKASFEAEEFYKGFNMGDAELLLNYHGGMSSYLYAVGSTIYAALMDKKSGNPKAPGSYSLSPEYILGAIKELEKHKEWLDAHPGVEDSGSIEEVDYLITKLRKLPRTGPEGREGSRRKALDMNFFKVTFEDGNTLTTGFNGTLEDAQAYYVGTSFQFGDTEEHPGDLMVKAVKVEPVEDTTPKSCRDCGSLAVGPDGLCWKCGELRENRRENPSGRGRYHHSSQRRKAYEGMDAKILAPLQRLLKWGPFRTKEPISAWKYMGFDVEVDYYGANSNKYEVIWEHPETKLFNEGATSDYERDMGHVFNTMEKLKPEYMEEYCSGGSPRAHGVGGSYALPPYLWTLGRIGNTTEVGIWPPREECAPVEVDTKQIPLGFGASEDSRSVFSVGEGDQQLHVWKTPYRIKYGDDEDRDSYWVSDADGAELEAFDTLQEAKAWALKSFGMVDTHGDIRQHTGSSKRSAHNIVVLDPEGQDHYDVVIQSIKDVVNTMKKANPRGFADEADSRFPTICLEVAQALGAQFRENAKGECIFDFSNPGASKSWLASRKVGTTKRGVGEKKGWPNVLRAGSAAYLDSFVGLVPCKVIRIFAERPSALTKAEVEVTKTVGAYKQGDHVVEHTLHVIPPKALVQSGSAYRILPYDVELSEGEQRNGVLGKVRTYRDLSFVTRAMEGLLDSDEIFVSSEAGNALVQIQDAILSGATPAEVSAMLGDILADPDANVSSELGETLESLQRRIYQMSSVARKAKRGSPDGIGLGKGSYEDILDALHKKGDTKDPEALAAWIFHKNTNHWPAEKANRPKKKKGSEQGVTGVVSRVFQGKDSIVVYLSTEDGGLYRLPMVPKDYWRLEESEGPFVGRTLRVTGSGEERVIEFLDLLGKPAVNPEKRRDLGYKGSQEEVDLDPREPGISSEEATQRYEALGLTRSDAQGVREADVMTGKVPPDPNDPYEVNLASGKYRLPRGGARKQAKEKTLAEQAEAWCSEKGAKIPPRGTAKWREMYEQWANWAFADLHPDKKKASSEEPATKEILPVELAPGMKLEHKGAFYTVKTVRSVDYGKDEEYLQVFFTDRDNSLLFSPRLKVKIKASTRKAFYDEDEGDDRPVCPMCGGPGNFLGALGHREHFRCESCGMDFSQTAQHLEGHPDFSGPATTLKPEVRGAAMGPAASPIWASAEEAKQWLDQIKEQVRAPYLGGYVSSLGGSARASIMLTVGGQPKDQWPNNILQNSTYAQLSLGHDGVLEAFSGWGKWKFRKTRVGTVEQAVAKLQTLANMLVSMAAEKTPGRGASGEKGSLDRVAKYETEKRIVKEYLDSHNLPYTKISARTIGFSDLARASKLFVTVQGWDPDHPGAGSAHGELKQLGRDNGFIVDFSGPKVLFGSIRKADPTLNEKLEHYMEYVNPEDDLTGYYVCPDGWNPPNGGEKLQPSEWEPSWTGVPEFKYRLPIRAPGNIKSVAVNVKVTGAPQHKWGALWQRVKIEFVGDGEPSEFSGGWILVKHPHTGGRKRRADGDYEYGPTGWRPKGVPCDNRQPNEVVRPGCTDGKAVGTLTIFYGDGMDASDTDELNLCPRCKERVEQDVATRSGYSSSWKPFSKSKSQRGSNRTLRPTASGEPSQRHHLIPSERESPCSHPHVRYQGEVPCTGPLTCDMCGAVEGDDPETDAVLKERVHGSVHSGRRSYSVIVSPSLKAFWSNQYGWVTFVDLATKFPFSSSDMRGMPPTEDGDAQWMPLEQAEKMVFGPEAADAPQASKKVWEEYADELPYPTHMARKHRVATEGWTDPHNKDQFHEFVYKPCPTCGGQMKLMLGREAITEGPAHLGYEYDSYWHCQGQCGETQPLTDEEMNTSSNTGNPGQPDWYDTTKSRELEGSKHKSGLVKDCPKCGPGKVHSLPGEDVMYMDEMCVLFQCSECGEKWACPWQRADTPSTQGCWPWPPRRGASKRSAMHDTPYDDLPACPLCGKGEDECSCPSENLKRHDTEKAEGLSGDLQWEKDHAEEIKRAIHSGKRQADGQNLIPARFRVSGLDLGRGVLGWYDPSESWNGFACPLFAKVAADKIIQAHNFPSTGNRGDDMKAYYDEAQDAYVFPEDNTYVGRDITTGSSNLYTESEGTTYTRHLYSIGDHSWPWEPHGGFMSVDSEG